MKLLENTIRSSDPAGDYELLNKKFTSCMRNNEELNQQIMNAAQQNAGLRSQLTKLIEEHAHCQPTMDEILERNKQLILLSERAGDHSACDKQISEFHAAYQGLEHEKNLAIKQVRGLSDHYEEAVAENIRKDKILADLTTKYNEVTRQYNEVATQLVDSQGNDEKDLVASLAATKKDLAQAKILLQEHAKCGNIRAANEQLEIRMMYYESHRQASTKQAKYAAEEAREAEALLENECRHLVSEVGEYRGDTEQRAKLIESAKLQFNGLVPQIGCEFQNSPDGGVLVTRVMPGMPSEAAGLQENDVIEQVQYEGTANSSDFKREVRKLRPGDRVSFQINRSGHIHYLMVEVGSPGRFFFCSSDRLYSCFCSPSYFYTADCCLLLHCYDWCVVCPLFFSPFHRLEPC